MGELQQVWGWQPALYLFLGGLSAGAFLAVSILRLARPGKFYKTIRGGVWVATGALALGLLALISEVEKPFQALLLWQGFVNGSSWMAIGAWLLLASFIVFALSALLTTDKVAETLRVKEEARAAANKVLAIIGIPCSLAVAGYTGILLSMAPAVPLWDTWLLPALFTVSALDTGVAAVMLFAVLAERDEGIGAVRRAFELAVIGLVVLEAIVLTAFVVSLQSAGGAAATSVGILTGGALQAPFWGLFVAVGLAVPLVAAVVQVVAAKRIDNELMRVAVPVGGSACALVGGLTLRFLILLAGVHAALASPAALQAIQGATFLIS